MAKRTDVATLHLGGAQAYLISRATFTLNDIHLALRAPATKHSNKTRRLHTGRESGPCCFPQNVRVLSVNVLRRFSESVTTRRASFCARPCWQERSGIPGYSNSTVELITRQRAE